VLDKILYALALAILDHLARRMERGKVAVDADLDLDRLRRAGSRIDEWLRQDGARRGGQPDEDWPPSVHQGLHQD